MKKATKSQTETKESEREHDTDATGLFAPERLRLSQDFAASLGVKKELLTVPVRKPDRQWFVRVHPDESYRMPVALIELRDDRETYVVDPGLCADLPNEVVPKLLFTAINKQGVVFLWPVRLPGDDGRTNEWNRSALAAAELATRRWIRVASDMALGAYQVSTATANLPNPEWPEVTFGRLLEIAFKDRIITSLDHAVLRSLRGEI